MKESIPQIELGVKPKRLNAETFYSEQWLDRRIQNDLRCIHTLRSQKEAYLPQLCTNLQE